MGLLSLILLIPLTMIASLVVTLQIVMKRRIVNQTQALSIGIGGIPFTLAVLCYAAYSLFYPANPGVTDMAVTVGASGAAIGGWIGASVACITNQARSGVPKLERDYQSVIARATNQGRSKTINDWLRRYGLPDNPSNVRLYLLGSFLVLILFVATMNEMISLGFWDTSYLSHLPSSWRIVGAVAPFAVPGFLWGVVRRWRPALGFGLRDGIASLMIVYVVYYAIFNMLAAPPAR